jgi:predicted Zn finger-like uncharacterized protein
MIITCPNCSIRYLLAAQALGAAGRRVKCSACNDIWFQAPSEEERSGPPPEDIPDSVKPIPEGSSVPAIARDDQPIHLESPGRVGGYAAAAAVAGIVFAFLLFFHQSVAQAMPGSRFFYSIFGYELPVPGEGLEFDRITAIARTDPNKREVIAIEGKIVNMTHEYRDIPVMQAALRTRAGEIADTWMIAPPKATLDPGESITFRALQDNAAPEDAAEVNIRFILNGQSGPVTAKTVSAGGGSNPAPQPDAPAHLIGGGEDSESPPHASAPPHPESSHASPGTDQAILPPRHKDAPADQGASRH